jgi:hypothetical protein
MLCVSPFEESGGNGLVFGGRAFLGLVLLFGESTGCVFYARTDRIQVGACRTHDSTIMLEHLYEGLEVLQIGVQGLVPALIV